MKLSNHTMYNLRQEAKSDINLFKSLHPKSKKRFKIKKEIFYSIEEVGE